MTVSNTFKIHILQPQSGPKVKTPAVLGIERVHTLCGFNLMISIALDKLIVEVTDEGMVEQRMFIFPPCPT